MAPTNCVTRWRAQSINNGMSLGAIARMLGHRSMRMTLVYARIADRTVADEYFRRRRQNRPPLPIPLDNITGIRAEAE